MSQQKVSSFAELSFLEAVARYTRVDLNIKPVVPGDARRLVSRFLGFQGTDRLVLDVPQAGGRKVFVPVGWQVGMAFVVGQCYLQARSTVVDHSAYQGRGTRRVDSLVVERPERILAADRREHPRHVIDPNVYIFVAIWRVADLAGGRTATVRSGRLLDRSEGGLGIRLESPLTWQVGTEVVVRLEQRGADQFPLLCAVLKHHPKEQGESWLAGFGDVRELAPGQAPALIEAIAANG
jgi:hypothetical protein